MSTHGRTLLVPSFLVYRGDCCGYLIIYIYIATHWGTTSYGNVAPIPHVREVSIREAMLRPWCGDDFFRQNHTADFVVVAVAVAVDAEETASGIISISHDVKTSDDGLADRSVHAAALVAVQHGLPCMPG